MYNIQQLSTSYFILQSCPMFIFSCAVVLNRWYFHPYLCLSDASFLILLYTGSVLDTKSVGALRNFSFFFLLPIVSRNSNSLIYYSVDLLSTTYLHSNVYCLIYGLVLTSMVIVLIWLTNSYTGLYGFCCRKLWKFFIVQFLLVDDIIGLGI